jgi:Holliday junction resolvase
MAIRLNITRHLPVAIKEEPVTSDWASRKMVGDAHEERVRTELASRGWTVDPWGQAILSGQVRKAVSRTRWKNFPDLVAARDGDLVAIDAKDRMSSAETGRYAISRECVSFGLQFVAAFGVPIFYVFGNLGVLTPQEVMSYGNIGPRGMGGSYYLITGRLSHQFDDVFGAPASHTEAA